LVGAEVGERLRAGVSPGTNDRGLSKSALSTMTSTNEQVDLVDIQELRPGTGLGGVPRPPLGCPRSRSFCASPDRARVDLEPDPKVPISIDLRSVPEHPVDDDTPSRGIADYRQ
jgi:hypothetical protein